SPLRCPVRLSHLSLPRRRLCSHRPRGRAAARPQSSPLSLHDALPIYTSFVFAFLGVASGLYYRELTKAYDLFDRSATQLPLVHTDRKSTRLNSSHVSISYAVFCLKKKKATNVDAFVTRIKESQKTLWP